MTTPGDADIAAVAALAADPSRARILLALAVQAHKRFGSLDPNDLRALRD